MKATLIGLLIASSLACCGSLLAESKRTSVTEMNRKLGDGRIEHGFQIYRDGLPVYFFQTGLPHKER